MKETAEIVDSFEIWKTTAANSGVSYFGHESISDVEGVEMLSPFVAGFMTSPVALLNDKPIMAATRRIDDIREFKDELDKSEKQIFLYQLHWIPSYPYYKELDMTKQEPVILVDGPHIKNGFWLVRYATV